MQLFFFSSFCKMGKLFYKKRSLMVHIFSGATFLIIIMRMHNTHDNAKLSPLILMGRCNSSKKIAFMKTHKCASSTIQRILLRLAYKLNLNYARPPSGYRFSTTELFNRKELLNSTWAGLQMDLISSHMRWSYDEVIAVLGPETKTFTILRDPVDQFESLFSYVGLAPFYGVNNLTELITSIRNNSSSKYDGIRAADHIGRNQMAFDLGLSPSQFDDQQAVDHMISKLEKEFHLVMIKERMEESLILLRHLLCLSIDDITSLAINVRKPEHVVNLNPEERKVLRAWLGADERIYRHFSTIFDRRVAEFGTARMEEEVRMLQLANQKLIHQCAVKQVGNEKLERQYPWMTNSTFGYLINGENPGCELFAFTHTKFFKILEGRMTKKLEEAGLKVNETQNSIT